jgi:indole-3-acetate O-methyltransferase
VAHAADFVPTTRTWSNSTFVTGATSSGVPQAEADAMVDEMFRRYEARVALAPEEHAMDYVHSYLHVAKAD